MFLPKAEIDECEHSPSPPRRSLESQSCASVPPTFKLLDQFLTAHPMVSVDLQEDQLACLYSLDTKMMTVLEVFLKFARSIVADAWRRQSGYAASCSAISKDGEDGVAVLHPSAPPSQRLRSSPRGAQSAAASRSLPISVASTALPDASSSSFESGYVNSDLQAFLEDLTVQFSTVLDHLDADFHAWKGQVDNLMSRRAAASNVNSEHNDPKQPQSNSQERRIDFDGASLNFSGLASMGSLQPVLEAQTPVALTAVSFDSAPPTLRQSLPDYSVNPPISVSAIDSPQPSNKRNSVSLLSDSLLHSRHSQRSRVSSASCVRSYVFPTSISSQRRSGSEAPKPHSSGNNANNSIPSNCRETRAKEWSDLHSTESTLKHGLHSPAIHNILERSTLDGSLLSARSLAQSFRLAEKLLKGYDDESGMKMLNSYLLLDTLGQGACGKVKLAFNLDRNISVAIKIARKARTTSPDDGDDSHDRKEVNEDDVLRRVFDGPEEIDDNSSRSAPPPGGGNLDMGKGKKAEALRREIAVMKKLRHKNIVSLYEVIDDPSAEKLYLVMQYIDKGSIATLRPNGTCERLAPRHVAYIASQVCSGLHYLHSHGIIHRDIKPENILMNSDRQVFVSDFGVSDIISSQGAKKSIRGGVGTPLFMPPELLDPRRRSSVTIPGAITKEHYRKYFAVDMWSLGVTLYVLLYGELPYSRVEDLFDPTHVVRYAVRDDDENLTPLPKPSKYWEMLISQLLDRDAKRRPLAADVRLAARRLEADDEFVGGKDTTASSAGRSSTRSSLSSQCSSPRGTHSDSLDTAQQSPHQGIHKLLNSIPAPNEGVVGANNVHFLDVSQQEIDSAFTTLVAANTQKSLERSLLHHAVLEQLSQSQRLRDAAMKVTITVQRDTSTDEAVPQDHPSPPASHEAMGAYRNVIRHSHFMH